MIFVVSHLPVNMRDILSEYYMSVLKIVIKAPRVQTEEMKAAVYKSEEEILQCNFLRI